jgi:predicted DNA-binding protein
MLTKKTEFKAKETVMPRASVSFPPEVYKTLENLAKQKKVSIAWIVRDAVEKYVAEQWPLFGNLKGN